MRNAGTWAPPARRTRVERALDVARFAGGILVYSTAYLLCVVLALAPLLLLILAWQAVSR